MANFETDAGDSALANLEDLVPALRLMPGEDFEMMHELHDQLMAELDPGTAYEQILAGNLVSLELETVRLRRMRDELLMNAMIDATSRVIGSETLRKQIGKHVDGVDVRWDIEREFDSLRSQFYRDRSGKKLSAYLTDKGYDAMAILAEAYAFAGEQLYPFEAQLAGAEQRRHRLLADFRDLKEHNGATLSDVDFDAELISDL